jgi:hypothetical protein
MSGMPKQGTQEQIAANRLSNWDLAHRIRNIRYNRREYAKAEADAFLDEAYKRLAYTDNYAKHQEQMP